MNYTFYITRKLRWHDVGNDILLEEWRCVVKTHPDISLTEYSEVGLENGDIFRYPNPGAAIWEKDKNIIHFDYLDGNLMATGEPNILLPVLKHLAFKLSAVLQEEEMRTYEIFAPADSGAIVEPAKNSSVFEPFRRLYLRLLGS